MTRKYHGIKAAVSAAQGWTSLYHGHTQIGYDITEDRVVYADYVGNSYCFWVDGIINVGNYAGKSCTIKQLKADIEEAIANAGN